MQRLYNLIIFVEHCKIIAIPINPLLLILLLLILLRCLEELELLSQRVDILCVSKNSPKLTSPSPLMSCFSSMKAFSSFSSTASFVALSTTRFWVPSGIMPVFSGSSTAKKWSVRS